MNKQHLLIIIISTQIWIKISWDHGSSSPGDENVLHEEVFISLNYIYLLLIH